MHQCRLRQYAAEQQRQIDALRLLDPIQTEIEKNHEAYANQGEIAASSAVKKLLKTEGRRLLDMRLS